MFKRSFEYGFMCELTLEAQKTLKRHGGEKNIYSIFLFYLYSDILKLLSINIQGWHQGETEMSNWGSPGSHFLQDTQQ